MQAHVIEKGTRIAQGVIAPVVTAHFVEVEELSVSERGVGGFGSTGTK
ncbi:Deoxyuridine 5'-triphosphate nucleotidohydrolase [Streptococcus pneumoniae]|nr:Deoxyuridine 5'-triphosphate nucleotidohydrolase [Streptococcus pneumoniae]